MGKGAGIMEILENFGKYDHKRLIHIIFAALRQCPTSPSQVRHSGMEQLNLWLALLSPSVPYYKMIF